MNSGSGSGCCTLSAAISGTEAGGSDGRGGCALSVRNKRGKSDIRARWRGRCTFRLQFDIWVRAQAEVAAASGSPR